MRIVGRYCYWHRRKMPFKNQVIIVSSKKKFTGKRKKGLMKQKYGGKHMSRAIGFNMQGCTHHHLCLSHCDSVHLSMQI